MSQSRYHTLNAGELDVVRLLSEGKTTGQIGPLLRVGRGTVSVRKRRIRKKLGLDARVGDEQIVARARQLGLTT